MNRNSALVSILVSAVQTVFTSSPDVMVYCVDSSISIDETPVCPPGELKKNVRIYNPSDVTREVIDLSSFPKPEPDEYSRIVDIALDGNILTFTRSDGTTECSLVSNIY